VVVVETWLELSQVYLDKCKKLVNNFFIYVHCTGDVQYQAISRDKDGVLLYFYFPKNVRSAQYGCLLQLLDVVLSRYIDQVFTE